MCMSVFTGCSLVTRSDKNYYEATVATISYVDGSKENISKRELITAYNSYGYNYVNNYGYTKKQAVKQTLKTVIEKKLTIKAVGQYYLDNPSQGEMLNGNETTYVWDQTYEAIYSNLKGYLKDILNIKSSDDSSSTSDNENKSVYKPFEKAAELDSSGKILKTSSATTIRETYKGRKNASDVYVNFEYKDADGSYVFKETMYQKVMADIEAGGKDWKNAYNKYLADIKKNYSYEKFKSDKDRFIFELDRVYSIMKDNYVVEKYEAIYNEQKKQDSRVSNVTVDDVLKYYSAKVRVDYTSYVLENGTSSFESSILSDVGSVDYILEGNNASNYFYVAPIKIEMTSTQKTELEKLKTDLANGSNDIETYEAEVNKIYNSLAATVRNSETGEKAGTISASELLKKINTDIAKYQYLTIESLSDGQKEDAEKDGLTLETYVERQNTEIAYKKAAAYRTYLYLYNDDDTLKGADYNTVFGVNSANEVLANDTFKDNEKVKEVILALYNDGNAKVGDTTEFVRADDGLYMFFFAGNVENLFKGIDENFDASKQTENIKTLTTTRLNIFSEKTLFDKIYAELTKDNFSVFQNLDMNALKQTLTIKIEEIENNLKDLY